MATKKTATATAPKTESKEQSKDSRKFKADDYSHLPSTSAKIRAMAKDGATKTEIKNSGLTTKEGNPIRYQHVRNVLLQPVKSATADVETK